jgi:hypothetical protein
VEAVCYSRNIDMGSNMIFQPGKTKRERNYPLETCAYILSIYN